MKEQPARTAEPTVIKKTVHIANLILATLLISCLVAIAITKIQRLNAISLADVVRVDPQEVFLGTIPSGETHKVRFSLTNLTPTPIKIIGKKMSCTCTTSDGDIDILMPHKTTDFVLLFIDHSTIHEIQLEFSGNSSGTH
jgi:hypothetical protein